MTTVPIVSSGEAIHTVLGADPTEKKIRSFQKLLSGWHYRTEGLPFESPTLDRAIRLHEEAVRQGFLRTDAFPGLRGEVVLAIYHDGDYLELTIEPDGTTDFIHERDGAEIACEEGLSEDEMILRIRALRNEIWMRSDSFTRSTMTGTRADSEVLDSGHPEKAETYPSSAKVAFISRGSRSASTSETIMRRGSQSFFGGSPPLYYPAAAG